MRTSPGALGVSPAPQRESLCYHPTLQLRGARLRARYWEEAVCFSFRVLRPRQGCLYLLGTYCVPRAWEYAPGGESLLRFVTIFIVTTSNSNQIKLTERRRHGTCLAQSPVCLVRLAPPIYPELGLLCPLFHRWGTCCGGGNGTACLTL